MSLNRRALVKHLRRLGVSVAWCVSISAPWYKSLLLARRVWLGARFWRASPSRRMGRDGRFPSAARHPSGQRRTPLRRARRSCWVHAPIWRDDRSDACRLHRAEGV